MRHAADRLGRRSLQRRGRKSQECWLESQRYMENAGAGRDAGATRLGWARKQLSRRGEFADMGRSPSRLRVNSGCAPTESQTACWRLRRRRSLARKIMVLTAGRRRLSFWAISE